MTKNQEIRLANHLWELNAQFYDSMYSSVVIFELVVLIYRLSD